VGEAPPGRPGHLLVLTSLKLFLFISAKSDIDVSTDGQKRSRNLNSFIKCKKKLQNPGKIPGLVIDFLCRNWCDTEVYPPSVITNGKSIMMRKYENHKENENLKKIITDS
jgi:hypothetical protein